jgi:hypothetical protein
MIDIKNRYTGKILYAHDADSLLGANLRGANLTRANLAGANLRGVDLSEANLSGANLIGADLTRANLRGADLGGAYLRHCTGDGKIIRSAQFEKYLVVACDDHLVIGCEAHRVHEWRGFSDDTIRDMDDGALEWWEQYRDAVLAFADCP